MYEVFQSYIEIKETQQRGNLRLLQVFYIRSGKGGC